MQSNMIHRGAGLFVLAVAFWTATMAAGADLTYSTLINGQTSGGAPIKILFPERALTSSVTVSGLLCGLSQGVGLSSLKLMADGEQAVLVPYQNDEPGCQAFGGMHVRPNSSPVLNGELSDGDSFSIPLSVADAPVYLTSETHVVRQQGPLLTGALTLPANPVTTRTKSGVLCFNSQSNLTEAKLWMVDMGHGTTPTTITPRGDGCFNIERMNFVMAGNWELRTKLANGVTLAFPLVVRAM